MNRQQRRANGMKNPVKTYTLTGDQVEKIKNDAAREAMDVAFMAMLSLPLITLHDKFGFGKQRLEKFADGVLEEWKCFDEGYVTIDDLKKILERETGIKIS